jgi:hypothetical protein
MNAVKKTDHQSLALTLRPGIEQETNLLNDAIMWAREAANGIMGGSFKPAEANAILGGGRLLASVAKQSISNRMGRSRLLAQEAKLIEAVE